MCTPIIYKNINENRAMHIWAVGRVTYDMVLKTRSRANIPYGTHQNVQICMALFSLMFLYMIGVHIKCITILFSF